jgi:hypothetical protein
MAFEIYLQEYSKDIMVTIDRFAPDVARVFQNYNRIDCGAYQAGGGFMHQAKKEVIGPNQPLIPGNVAASPSASAPYHDIILFINKSIWI